MKAATLESGSGKVAILRKIVDTDSYIVIARAMENRAAVHAGRSGPYKDEPDQNARLGFAKRGSRPHGSGSSMCSFSYGLRAEISGFRT
jgi:hypothetical protein